MEENSPIKFACMETSHIFATLNKYHEQTKT